MYCVKCGVKLQDGVKSCPLCQTPVICDLKDLEAVPQRYSDLYPEEDRHARLVLLSLVTALMVAASLVTFLICITTYGAVLWSAYVMLGLALVWIVFILPCWFRKWMPLLFLPIDCAALCGFLLFVCLYNGERWFLSFAFPVTMIVFAIAIAAYMLFRNLKRGRLLVLGGLITVIGCSCMLVELFQHITFGSPMFQWSLWCVGFFAPIGLFFIIAALIPPLRAYIARKFFV